MSSLVEPLPKAVAVTRFERLSLAGQFALAAALVLIFGMGAIGLWVTARIEEAVTRNAAVSTALYVDAVIAPLTQELANSDSLSEGAQLALQETLGQGVLGGQMFAFKIWRPDGTVIYSNEQEVVGHRFPITEGLSAAAGGTVHAEYDHLGDEENAVERRAGLPLLEIYSPVREPWSGKVIAVAEFYQAAEQLAADLGRARIRSWLVVAGVTLAMLALLFAIVARGSRTITRQRQALDAKIDELSKSVEQNKALRLRAEEAGRRAAAINEQYLKRISAELHDGPVQLLAFAALRVPDLHSRQATEDDAKAISDTLDEAMQEIRNICRGLSLPELDGLDPPAVIRRAVQAHGSRTSSRIALTIGAGLPALSPVEKICVYRFLQETLSNATRHAGTGEIRVEAASEGGGIRLTVTDAGRGFDTDVSRTGLGLAGLEERIASVGGSFSLETAPGQGTRVSMILDKGMPK